MSHQPNPDSSGEIAWPPYDTVNAASVEKSNVDFWSELSDAEQQRLRDIAIQLDAATGISGSLSVIITIANNKNGKVRP